VTEAITRTMTRILFVDDEVKILEGLQRMLRPQRHEWQMDFAPGGKPALRMLEASSFDVIVSDMRMPEIDGASLLNIVREKYPSVIRIILSGYTELEASYRAVPVAHQFLLKPCDPDALRAAIERATSLIAVLNSKTLAGLVGSLQELPSLPRTYARLRTALSEPDTSLDEVVRIVESDVAISAKVLQLVNSAFFGVTREISDIKAAVGYLGITVLQNLVLSVEIFRTFHPKRTTPGFSIEKFDQHSHLTARIASEIGRTMTISNAVVVAGLLHDIGKLVIAESAPEHLRRAILVMHQEQRPLFDVEEQLIGVSHAEVGAYLLSLWGLPSPVVEAVAHHHHPERVSHDKLDMLCIVYLSNLLAHEYSGGNKPAKPQGAVHPVILAVPGVLEKLPQWQKMAEAAAREPQGAIYA
jgi:putative nucleotidyltransferase with HDIG domain